MMDILPVKSMYIQGEAGQIYEFSSESSVGSHTHGAEEIVSGVLPIAYGGTGGTTANTAKAMLGINAYTSNLYTALGTNASSAYYGSVAIGLNSYSIGANSTVIGHYAYCTGSDCVIAGSHANSSACNAVLIGPGTSNYNASFSPYSGYNAIVLGNRAQACRNNTIAMGTLSSTFGLYSIAIGMTSNCRGHYSIALGPNSSAVGNNSIAFGSGAATLSTEAGYMQLGGPNISVIRIATSSLTTTSDARDKTDVLPVEDSLEFLARISPKTYVFNYRTDYLEEISQELEALEEKAEDKEGTDLFTGEELERLLHLRELQAKRSAYGLVDYDRSAHTLGEKKHQRRRTGVLAQEVQEAMMEQYGTDNYADLIIDNFYELEDVPEGIENQLGVNYSNFIPFLIDGVNRLGAQCLQLAEENKALLLRVEALEQ